MKNRAFGVIHLSMISSGGSSALHGFVLWNYECRATRESGRVFALISVG
jgi:hypothetical protein